MINDHENLVNLEVILANSQLVKRIKQLDYFPSQTQTKEIPSILAELQRAGVSKAYCRRLLQKWLDDRGNAWEVYQDLAYGIALACLQGLASNGACGLTESELSPRVRKLIEGTIYWRMRHGILFDSKSLKTIEVQVFLEILRNAAAGDLESVDYLLKFGKKPKVPRV